MHADYCYRCSQCLSVCLSVSVLSCTSTRLHCAKTAEQIKILFGVNTEHSWGPKEYCGVLIIPQRVEGNSMQPLPNYFGVLLTSANRSIYC